MTSVLALVLVAATAADPVFAAKDVEPSFAGADEAKAAKALDLGDADGALALLPATTKDLPGRFLRALALWRAGKSADAAKAFDALSPKVDEWLRPRVECLAAKASEDAGDEKSAEAHELACADDPVLGRLAKVEHAKLLAALGRRDEAAKELEPLAAKASATQADALFALAELRESQGRWKDALEAWRGIYLDLPANPLAKEAFRRGLVAGRNAKAPPPPDDRLAARVEKLLAANQLRQAIADLRDLHVKPVCDGDACPAPSCGVAAKEADDRPIDPPAPAAQPFVLAELKTTGPAPHPDALPACAVTKVEHPASALSCEVQLLQGLAARRTRVNAKALGLLYPVYARCEDASVRARALFAAASAANAVGDENAAALATLAGRQFPDAPTADDALMLAASIHHDAGERDAERAALTRVVDEHPDSDLRAEALFRLFWSHRAEGHPELGLADLDVLSKEYDAGPRSDGGDAERGRYWWGRTVAESAGAAARPEGIARLTALAHDRPTTYYGLLARSYLASLKPPVDVAPVAGPPDAGPLRLGALEHDRAFRLGEELLRIGLKSDARLALLATDFTPLESDGRRGVEATIAVLELFRSIGDDRSAQALARRELLGFLRDASDPLARRASLLAYPLAFRGAVEKSAAEASIAPDFLEGLMREESALDPRARSPVGARGLTQLMPATARQVARRLGLRGYTTQKLWDPATNIRLGGAYLGRMVRAFGHVGLAAAAYNAGPGAVSRWLGAASNVFDEFVEDIPFRETRGYVKRVLRSYAAYTYLYGGKDARGATVSLTIADPTVDADDGR